MNCHRRLSGWDRSSRKLPRMSFRSSQPVLRTAFVALLGIAVAGCGGGADPVTSAAPTVPDATTPTTTTPAPGSTSVAASPTTSAPEADSEAVLAPDFTLALGEGGEFVLSAETKPVYLVFWAEW